MVWILATGVPLLGVAVLAVGYLTGVGFQTRRTFAAILVLAGVALVVGLLAILVAVRSVSERISALAEHILRAGTPLAGEELEVTMMFVDVRGFTASAERQRPADVVATLNRLFERIVPLVHHHGGHVDKYAGDGLFAVFGALRRHSDHADRALSAAIQIAEAVGDEFDGALSVGVGLNSGPVLAGNVGGAGRLEFSVIGDAVNMAARVESATRLTGDTVLLTKRTLGLLSDDFGEFVERPGLTLRGKTAPVQIYAPAS